MNSSTTAGDVSEHVSRHDPPGCLQCVSALKRSVLGSFTMDVSRNGTGQCCYSARICIEYPIITLSSLLDLLKHSQSVGCSKYQNEIHKGTLVRRFS